jgi:hypothetical protein
VLIPERQNCRSDLQDNTQFISPTCIVRLLSSRLTLRELLPLIPKTINGNGSTYNETSMGSNGIPDESKASIGANGTGIQAEMSKLFRLENRTVICKTCICHG